MGGIPGPCPLNHCSCYPKRKLCPPKRGLCPKESNRLGATGVQFEAWESQNTGCHSRIREQKLLFCKFYNKDRLFLWPHPRIHENLRILWHQDLFFVLVFTSEFVEIRTFFAMKTRFVELCVFFVMKTFFFCLNPRFRRFSCWTPISFAPHSWILAYKVFVPAKNLFMPPQ